jgi:hypothetical protein
MASRVVYENRWMRVREDAIERQDGSPGFRAIQELSRRCSHACCCHGGRFVR